MAETAAAPVVAPEDDTPSNVEDALRIVVRKSLEANGLVRGLSEVARAIDRELVLMCILASDCEDPHYKQLIQALCKQHNVDIIEVGERKKLAEWAGLVKYDSAGNVKKTHKCSSVAIKDFGEKTKALNMLMQQLQ